MEDPMARLARYKNSEDGLNGSEIKSILEGRCGPLLYGGPCWLMPEHTGPHHCYRDDIQAVIDHVTKDKK